MASIFTSLINTITTTLDTVTDVMGAGQETVSMGTEFIHNRAKAQQITDRDSVAMATTLELENIQAQLDGNEKRKALFETTRKMFD